MLSAGVGGGGDTENTDWDTLGEGNPADISGTPEACGPYFLNSRASGFTVGDVITCDGGSVVSWHPRIALNNVALGYLALLQTRRIHTDQTLVFCPSRRSGVGHLGA